MEVKTRTEKLVVVISIKGRIDTVAASELEKRISETIDSVKNILILNMSEVDYISSTGLRVVLSSAKEIKAKQGEILLVGVQGLVKKVFEMSGFSMMFKIFETEEDALKQE
jgi:anti-anti-sigma factor